MNYEKLYIVSKDESKYLKSISKQIFVSVFKNNSITGRMIPYKKSSDFNKTYYVIQEKSVESSDLVQTVRALLDVLRAIGHCILKKRLTKTILKKARNRKVSDSKE